MWIDTYYVDPSCVIVAVLHPLTTMDLQVANLDSEQETLNSEQETLETGSPQPDTEKPRTWCDSPDPVQWEVSKANGIEVIEVNETEVSSDKTLMQDEVDSSKLSKGKPVTLPYVIYNPQQQCPHIHPQRNHGGLILTRMNL